MQQSGRPCWADKQVIAHMQAMCINQRSKHSAEASHMIGISCLQHAAACCSSCGCLQDGLQLPRCPAAIASPCCLAAARSRDASVLAECDVIIDVGGVYEPENNRFDHHQRGFSEVFGHGYNTKLSSAGAASCSSLLVLWRAACHRSVAAHSLVLRNASGDTHGGICTSF